MMIAKNHFFLRSRSLSPHPSVFLVPSLSVRFNTLFYPLDISRCFLLDVPLNMSSCEWMKG